MAREIHDQLGQVLTGLKFDLFSLKGTRVTLNNFKDYLQAR